MEEGIVGGGGGKKSLRLDREHSVWESVRKKHRAQDKKEKQRMSEDTVLQI